MEVRAPRSRPDALIDRLTGARAAPRPPAPGLPQDVIGGGVADPGVNRMYVSISTPLGFDGATFAGERVLMESERGLGRFVYSRYVEGPPGATRTLRMSISDS